MTKKTGTNRPYTLVGWSLFIYGLISLFSEIFAFKSPQNLPDSLLPFMRTQLQVVNSLFFSALVLGSLIIIRGKQAACINFTISFITLLLFCGLTELVLRLPCFQDPEKNKTVWIPPRLKERDQIINKPNYERAAQHPFGFNDAVRTISKPDGKKRIVILGDSVVWGEGLPYYQSWNHLLEEKIVQKYPRFEVMSWGKRGWSTWDEFQFLKTEGIKHEIDYLIVGFVDNDPDWANITQKKFIWQGAYFLKPFNKLFPNLFDFMVTHINNIMEKRFLKDYDYQLWLDQLYSDENLSGYATWLEKFSEFCKNNKISLLFVLTPHETGEAINRRFEKIIPLLEGVNIPYLNLFPAAHDRFHTLPDRKLWANPANSHPGPLLTHLIADEVFDYLENHSTVFSNPD